MSISRGIFSAGPKKLRRGIRAALGKTAAAFVATVAITAGALSAGTVPAWAFTITQAASGYINTETATNYNYASGVSLDSYLAGDGVSIPTPCATGTTNPYLFDTSLTLSYDSGCTTGSVGVLHHWYSYMYYRSSQLQVCEISNTPVRIKLNGTVIVDDFNSHGLPAGDTIASVKATSPKPPSNTSTSAGWSGQSIVNIPSANYSTLTANNTYTNGYRVDVYAWSNTNAFVGVYFDNATCNANSTNNIPYLTSNVFGGTPTSYATVSGGSVTQNIVPLNANVTSATSVTTSGATLNGTVTPGTITGVVTGQFQYSTSSTFATYSSISASGTFTSGSGTAAAATANVTGLASNTTYYYRLVASNATSGGTSTSVESSFTTGATTSAPAIASASVSGSAVVGQTLTASSSGVSGAPSPTETYQWYSNGTAISGETSSTFTVGAGQLGTSITVTITETNGSGTASATSSGTSNVVPANSAPAIASASISGTPTVGQTLTSSYSGVTGYPTPTITYQWYANGVAISGATASTFLLTSAQVGAVITVVVSASNGVGSSASATSSATSAVVRANAAPTISSATISGTATVGQTLTASSSGVTGYPAPTETYQWNAGGVAISGATSSTFVITGTQVGSVITVTITETNGSGNASATSSGTSSVIPANSAPAIASATISGTPTQNQTLTASYSGVTGYPAPTITYQWYANGVAISGATSSTYTLGLALVGSTITVRVTATNSSGSAAATSGATSAVAYANLAPGISAATISGSTISGQTLTAHSSGVTGYPAPTETYQWYSNGSAISGATASTYTLTDAEIGTVITVVITESNTSGPDASATSSPTATITHANIAPAIASATISGTTTQGQTLTATASGVTGYPNPTLLYQWYANGVAISGATSSTFLLTASQVGAAITVRITATNGIGTAAWATSSASAVVVPPNSAPAIASATISGTPVTGQTLTAAATGVTGYPAPTLTYQWYAGGVLISGATASTFLLTSAQVGAIITVVITATNGVGSPASATSAATVAVTAPPAAAAYYTINASAGAHGSISPAGACNVATGANQTFTITAASGYQTQSVLIDGVSVPVAANYSFINVLDTHTIVVTFVSSATANAPTPVEVGTGNSIATHDGQPVPVTVTPNSSSNGLTITGDNWTLSFQGVDASGNPAPLTASGYLVLTPGHQAATSGTGFAPNSTVQLWIFSTPTLLGTFTTDATGNFSGTVSVPSGLVVGAHTLLVQGTGATGVARKAALGVIAAARPLTASVKFAGDSAAINAKALATLKALATSLKKVSQSQTVTIHGWVAATANAANDAKLSLARAASVKAALSSLGVKANFVLLGRGIWDVANTEAKKADILVTFGSIN